MPLELKDVFAGKGMRCRKIEKQAAIDDTSVSGLKISEGRKTGQRAFSAQRFGQYQQVPARDANNADSATARGRGYRSDRFRRGD